MNREPPMYRVHPLTGGEDTVEDEEETTKLNPAAKQVSETVNQTINWLFVGITWAILAVVLLVWAVVGAIFWIPLLIRAMLRFSISLTESIFEGHKPAKAGKGLQDAVSFYRRGFVVAVEVVTRESLDRREEGPVAENRLMMEALWALLVWYFIALLFGWIQASPLDLWDWFVSIPWGELFTDLLQRFRV